MREKLIVIGGTAAGLSAASSAKRLNRGLDVVVYEKTGYISYGSCGIPYYIGGVVKDANDLITFSPDRLQKARGIRVKTRHEVTRIDRIRKQVYVVNLGSGELLIDNYDQLVIATGASAYIPPIQGIDKRNVFTIRHMEDGIAIRNVLEKKISKVVIVGAGYIGLEVATELKNAGHDVTLIETLSKLLPELPDEYSDMILDELGNNGVHVHLDSRVEELLGEKTVAGVKAGGKIYNADIVILSTGVTPNGMLAKEAGLDVANNGAIIVDKNMLTSDKSVYACGDCVQTFSIIDDRPVYSPLGTTANKQGKIAGQNIGGNRTEFWGVLGSQITKVFDLYVGSVGYSKSQAEQYGYEVECCAITNRDIASYYPGGGVNNIMLVFEKETGTILGMQATGTSTISGRLNVIATAISAKMTVNELYQVDFVYSPPVATVYDPLLIAASASKKLL